MASKQNFGDVVPGQCITRKPDPDRPGKFIQCTNPRNGKTWYCDECTADWNAHREGARARSTGDGRNRYNRPDDIPYGTGAGAAFRDSVLTDADGVILPQPTIERSGGSKVWSGFPGPVVGNQGKGVPLVSRPLCEAKGHDGQTPCLTLPNGKLLYGAQGSKLNNPDAVGHLDLIIDCAGLVTSAGKFVKKAPNRRFAALNVAEFPDVLRLDWPDMSAPVHVGIRFWSRLLDLLPQHTAVCCMGGHGRTGTALAALLIASGTDPDVAIATVREKHCRRAIETAGQEAYLRGLGKGGR